MYTFDEWKELFEKVNEDCLERGEGFGRFVPFEDWEYYQNQILNICEQSRKTMSEMEAEVIAKKLSNPGLTYEEFCKNR